MEEGFFNSSFNIFAVGIILFFYFMPTIFAFRHGRPDSWAILIINTAFGWTLIGWIGSMFWSLAPVHRQ